jgi:EAL domain-containing protein (putative c-di-GMP-specific phosphodiesterase class I)
LLHGQLSLAYQPIVDPVDRIVVGVEALVRWNDPRRGDVPALTIIGAAERSALINDIGRWVLRRACSDHRGWSRRHRDLRLELSVNLSAREIASPAFAETVADVLHDMQMDPSALILEVTETLPVGDDAASTETLLALRRLGVRLALDDFGTGASTIDDLQRLPVQIVKIDQRFIARLAQPDADTTIVSAVTALAHQLGMKVVAEGIEHPNQHDHVTDIGCDHAQGYLYARPMSSADLADYLEDCQMLAGHGRH